MCSTVSRGIIEFYIFYRLTSPLRRVTERKDIAKSVEKVFGFFFFLTLTWKGKTNFEVILTPGWT